MGEQTVIKSILDVKWNEDWLELLEVKDESKIQIF